MLFGPDVVEGRNGECVDGRGRKERIATAKDGDDAHRPSPARGIDAEKTLTSPFPLLRVNCRNR